MSVSAAEYSRVQPDTIGPLSALLGQALHFTPDGMRQFLERLGIDNLRLMRQGSRILAGLALLPTSQWFGGALVPTAAISAVGVAPEARGRGVGRQMLQAMLAEVHAGGTPLSVLYPSTLSFYRSVGYERAGTRLTYELPLTAITRRDSALEIVPLAQGDVESLRPVYEQFARRHNGMFDRPAAIWQTILDPGALDVRSYLILRGDTAEGYLSLVQAGRHEPLRIRDLALLSRAAGARALTLLADHRVFIDHVRWVGSPEDPLVALLAEQRYSIVETFDWVLRIVDVAGALRSRGYPRGLHAELELELEDDLLTHNSGRWLVRIANGRATVERGGAGRIQLGILDLAALYSGHLTPATLRLSGELRGPDDDLALLGLVFSGAAPRLTDPF